MKGKRVLFLLLVPFLGLLALSCSLPQGLGERPPNSVALAVTTDTSRNQGVYQNEKGLQEDILGYEEQDARTVKCVEAVGIVPLEQPSPAMGLKGGSWVKALVLGMRDDGKPGVWEIDGDDSIHPVHTWKGGKSSCLPESEDRDGAMRGLFGWKYYPIAIRTDGAGTALIVGKAVNNGFKLGRAWSIEKGTTVGVYWKLQLGFHKHFVLASPARVIGIGLEQARIRHWKSRHLHGRANLVLSSLNLFLLSYYEDYLTDLKVTREDPNNQEAFYWDAKQAVFGVKGKDKNSDNVIATISLEDVITFVADKPPDGGGAAYPRIIIETYQPQGGVNAKPDPLYPANTYLTLYGLKNGIWKVLAEDDNSNTDSGQGGSSRIDSADSTEFPALAAGLAPGTYYLKVTQGFGSKSLGPYAVRVIAVDFDATTLAVPHYDPNYVPVNPDPYEDRDASSTEVPPLSKTPVIIRLGGNLGRILGRLEGSDYVDPNDVDWIMVILPEVVNP